jgi:IucA / IucC family/Ferric iron reductase FhuF-like transporter
VRAPVVPGTEEQVILAFLTTLLREDVAGLRTRGRLVTGADGRLWLARHRLRIPVRRADPARGDQVGDLAARAPVLLRVGQGHPGGGGRHGRRARLRRLPAVLNAVLPELVRGLDDEVVAEFRAGFAALREEARAAADGARLRRRHRAAVLGRLRPSLTGPDSLGWAGSRGFETLAAHRDHPLYPFSAARVGIPAAELTSLAPEHRPAIGLGWLVLPEAAVEVHGRPPHWWPAVPGGTALPVHPAVRPADLSAALRELGIEASPSSPGFEPARPTLSLRTVALDRDPAVHLKLPVPMRTLGRLNLRTLARPTLADGALISGLVRSIVAGEPGWAGRVEVADESTWLHAGHPLLAVMVRRWDGGDGSVIAPVAALAAAGPDGRAVIDGLADRFAGGDRDALLLAYLRLLLGWAVTLWLRYGVVLESHPQNVLLAVGPGPDGPRLRLLLRDLDSGKLDLAVLAERLGPAAPTRADLADQRLAALGPRELSDLFVTTTLHQCVAAVLIDVGAGDLRRQVRPLLLEAAAAHPPGPARARLEAVVAAARLPVKRALTAATLLPKTRTGATDVNKYYGADAPSYL